MTGPGRDVDHVEDLDEGERDLLDRARLVRDRAYAPYSGFRVGCALRTADGRVFEGVNVENAVYPVTGCAEQTAIRTMVTAGVRGPVRTLAVIGDGDDPCTPCGACRQVIHEFGPDAVVLSAGDDGTLLRRTLGALLPHAFGPDRLRAEPR